ncbi:lipid-binding SYLF domain-containing protein [Salinisphaera sp. RV14]|uniref:lipid-binding SYLF domain-containing protein n=1 Tax=unclassified Salinisphaera TaxID=2649847 RepID=UPI003F85334A
MKRWMTVLASLMLIIVGGLTTSSAAIASSKQAQKMDDATSVLQQFVNIPENKIPSALLRQAYGIAVIPSVLKIGFIGAGEHGDGVLSVRTADGKWSDPTFISLSGGSVGFQAGVSSTDIILVFKTQRSISRLADGQFSLGADASVAAGPVGRKVGAATNGDFNAEVYSYSRSRGLFGGVSLSGAHIGIKKDWNWLYYNQSGISARTLLTRDSGNLPKSGRRFVYTLNQYMPPSNDHFHYDAHVGGANNSNNQGGGDTGDNGAASNHAAGAQSNQGTQGYGQTQPYNGGSNSGVTVQQNGSGGNNADGTSDYSSGTYGGSGNNGSAANNNGQQTGGAGSQGY